MITLMDVTRSIPGALARLPVLSDVSTHFGAGERVGILAPAGAGKSTIARMLCGIEKPDRGRILRQGRVSWPLGFAGGFHPELSIRQNITLLSDMLHEPPVGLMAFCVEFGELGGMTEQPMKLLSPGARLATAFSFSLSVQCDMYIADETIGFGDGMTRRKSEAMLDRRLQEAGLIFISRNPAQLAKHCDRFLVLLSGKLKECASPEIGMKALALLGMDETGPFGPDAGDQFDVTHVSRPGRQSHDI